MIGDYLKQYRQRKSLSQEKLAEQLHVSRQAITKWEKRKRRINKNRIVVLCTDMEDFCDETYENWVRIPYPKVLFSAVKRMDSQVVYYPEFAKRGSVADLIPERKFYKNGILTNALNSLGE